MSISTSETAVESSDIFELYDFQVANNHYYYTSNYESIFNNDQTYNAEAIERTGFNFTIEPNARQCTVSIPATNALALIFRDSEVKPIKLTIDRHFSADPDSTENIFIGRAVGINFGGGLCNIVFASIMQELERQICKVRMQALCNNILFDSVCALDSDTYRSDAVVTVSGSGKTLTSASFGAHVDDYYTLGKIYFATTDSYRMITSHTGNAITIQYAFAGLTDGMTVRVWPGCNKHPGLDCTQKFNNLASFVGMPYIPLKDTRETAITNVLT